MRMAIALFAIFLVAMAGASALYALVITNQTNTNVVLSYGIWGDTSFDLTSDLEGATGPIAWSTTGVPDNVSAVFSNTTDSGATLTLNQLNNGPNAGTYQMNVVATAQSGESTSTSIAITVQQRAFSIRGSFTANNKTYDRSASATVATNSLTPGIIDVLDGDDVSLVPVVTFANATAGAGKTVTISSSSTLTGAQAGNYYITLSGAPTTTATISQRPVTITPPTFSKTYDSTTTATPDGSPTLNGVLSGDSITISGSPTFTYGQKSVGTNISVTPSVAYGLSGSTAGNYSLTQPTFVGDITARNLSITFAGVNKTYDGTATAAFSVASDNRVAGDTIGTISATTSQFTQTGVGTGITVNISGISGNGADAGNYTFPASASTTADITARNLTIGGTLQVSSTRVYDKTQGATITDTGALTLVNTVAADVPNLSLSGLVAQYASKTVGASKNVTLTAATLSGTARLNYNLSLVGAPTATASITAKSLAVTISATNKSYDGTATASVVYSDDRLSGDTLTVSGTAAFDSKSIGTNKTVTAIGITLSGTDAANYTANTTATTTATITQRALLVGITGGGKTYDGTTAATVTYTDNRVSGDNITVSGSASYATKTAAAGKTITATGITVSGADAANYTANTTATVTATITQRSLLVGITGGGKVYNASTAATVTYTDDRVSGDTLTVSGTASYADKTAAPNKTITATGITLSGTDAANYTANTTATTTATITQRALVITGTYTPSNKVYDATSSATVTPPASPTLATIQGTDSVSLAGTPTFSFAQSGVGTAIAINTNGYSLAGGDAANYTLTLPTLSANITVRTVTVSGTLSVTSTKVYDGTVSASFVNSGLLTLANVPAGDSGNSTKLALASPVAQYANKTVGTSKAVSLTSASLSGTSSANYTLNLTGAPTATANITSRSLVITATGVNKTYDGSTTATVTLSSDKIASDTVTLAYTTATYATKIVENNKTVSVSGISISGADSGNYTANTTATTTANITQRSLTVTITASNKVYDGSTTASVTYGSNKVAADSLTITGTATFANKSVGSAKTVTATGITVTGADSANYVANTTATTTANITQRSLTVTITASNKVYDGSTTASVTYADDRISGDLFNVSGTPNFESASAGSTKTVTATGISLSGTDAANYSPNTSATATANVTVRTLTVTISGGSKTYDSTTTATVTYGSDKIAADTLTITGTATYADKTAAAGKTVTATGIAISGTSSGNYVLGNTTATTTATINKRVLTITGAFTASNRVYDGTADATGNVSVPVSPGITPVQGSDSVSLTGTPSFTYASANVGTAVAITGSGYSVVGADAPNYTLTQLSLSSNITVRTVTIGGSLVVPSTKTYDATTSTTITNTSALTLGNVATIDSGVSSRLALTNLVAQYANKNVADGKTVSLTSAGLTGTSMSNYVLNTAGAPTATSSITLRPLTVSITATNKVYNASTAASVTYSDNRVSGDQFTVSGVATFDSKNYGDAKTVTASGITLTGSDAANYSQNSVATTTANITRRSLTVTGTFTVANRQYDATTDATSQVTLPVSAGLSDVQAGDDATLTGTPTFTFAQATVGNGIAISTTGYSVTGTDAANYVLTPPSFTANITHRPLTIGGTLSVIATKTYNRSTAAAITDTSLLTLVNVPAGDANNAAKVALTSLTATYDNKNVGTGKTVSVSNASLTGSTAANYTVTTAGAPTATADITQRPITLGFTLNNKTYDGTVTATVSFSDTRVSGDSLTVSGTPTWSDKNVGTSKTVTATNMAISGTDAANYSYNSTATSTASILARALTVTITATSKTYDGNSSASVVYADNRIAGDDITVSGTATFANKNYGLTKTVTANNITLSGADAGNYSPNSSTTTTANITKRPLTVTITASNKTYDRTTTASVTYGDDRVSGDVLVISSTPTFADKNAGDAKTVTANSITLSSTDAGNYSYNTTATTTANITKRPLTIGINPSGKVYNATNVAAVSYTDNRVSGDSLAFSSTATFNDKNVGTSKTVTATGIAVTGADAGNYDHNTTATSTATITKRPLTVTGTFTVVNRQYDATTDATSQVTLPLSAGLSDVQAGDDATLTGTPTFTFAQATVGTGISISTSGYSITGVDANNYALTQPSFTASITQRPVTIGGALVVSVSKVYDRTVAATITDPAQLQLQNVPAGDANNSSKVALTGLGAAYGDKNVGTSKAVTLTAASLAGTTSANYSLSTAGAPSTTADITRRSVTISITATSKTYDGTDVASVAYGDTRISSDSFSVSGTATFSDKNVGTAKTVTASGITLSGTDSGNYTPNTTATTTANITRRTLVVTTTGINKVYDRTTAASVTFSDNRVSGDVFTYSATSTFNTKVVGVGKPVSTSGISLSGTDSGNYTPNTTASTTANITARPLTVTITATNKTYDGTSAANVTYVDDRVSGDLFTVSGSPAFDNKNVGTAKTVTATSILISGSDAGNYTYNSTATTTADVTVRTLTVTAAADSKIYDATVNATAVYSDNRVSGDVFTVTGTATFATKTAALGKTVSITNIAISGADAGNYQQNLTATSTADIEQRPLEVTGTLQAQDKVYDGTRTATYDIADLTLVGVQGGDLVGVTNPRGRFRTDANVGVNKVVELTSFQFTGADLGNYAVSVNNSPITYASITARNLTVTISATNKTYDGTTAASVTYSDNRVNGDIFTVTGTPTFSSKTAVNGKTVTATGISISGADSANYTNNTTATTTANITARSLTVTISATNKTYDRTTAASVTYSDNRVNGDIFTVTGTPTFSDKTVGVGKTVTATGITISGADSANYVQNTTATTTADITVKTLAVTITATNKTYDANDSASVTYTDNRISGDLFTVTGTATFDDKTAADGKTVTATGITLAGTDAANYSPNTTATAVANVAKRTLTITGTFIVANRQYDATTDATGQITLPVSAGLSAVQAGDDATLTGTPTFTFAQATVGTGIGITTSGYSLTGADAANYTLNLPTFTANITRRPLTIGGALVVSPTKTYDRTTSSTITDGNALTLLNVPSGDTDTPSKVALSGIVAQYNDKTAAPNKSVSLTSASLSGTAAANYTLSLAGSPTTTADITAKALTVTITATNRVYNSSDSASVTYADNRISGDLFAVSGTATFADKNVGNSKTVTASGITLTGTDANNYTPNTTATTTANITAKALTVTITASNKTYDSTTAASVTYLDNRISGDQITVSGTATFVSKVVGSSKTVTASGITLSGADSANYTPNTTATTTANIAVRTLTITATATDRIYDRTTAATVSLSDDRVSGDLFTVTHSPATFSSKVVGTNKTVTVSGISISGADSANYTHVSTVTTTATISARTLTVTATPTNKVYDGTDAATVTYSDNRVSGDILTVSGDATFSSKAAAAGKTVSTSNLSISGQDSSNYVLPSVSLNAVSTATITPRVLTITGNFTVSNRQYDATTDASAQVAPPAIPGLSGVQLNDDVTLSGAPSFTFAQASVGSGIGITTSGYTLIGTDAANYTLTLPTFAANITRRQLTIGGSLVTPSARTYNRTTSASITTPESLVLENVPAGDANDSSKISLASPVAEFADTNVGTGKTVSLVSASLAGNLSGNYTLTLAGSPTTTADITAKALTVTITATNKTYDATTAANVTYLDNRISGDQITVSGTATFADKNVGNSKTVTASGITLTGIDANNYSPNITATATANITSKALTVTITATNKTYDATTAASVTYADNRISGDLFAVSGTAAFADKNVGTGKTVTASGITLSGADSANYTPNTTATTTANITAKALTVTITATNKVYNSSDSASVTYADNRINGDVFTVSGTATFADKNVGTGKTVTASGITLSGADSANYTPNTTATTTANITQRPLLVSAVAENKAYDATTAASVNYSDNRINGDVFTVSGTASFDDAELGRNKPVSISNISLSGVDAGNYLPNSTTTSSGDITVRELSARVDNHLADVPLSDSTPTVEIGDLVPLLDTAVTFTRTGHSNVVCTITPQNTTETCTSPALADGTWTFRVRQFIAGLMVAASDQMTVTIDTTAPLATRPATFTSSSDTGSNRSDGVTSDNTPAVVVVDASPNDSVTVSAVSNGRTLQCSFMATAETRTCVLPTLTDGTWSVTAVITDRASNASTPTPAFNAVIDTVIPALSAAPYNAQDNGASTSLDATPRISVAGVAAGDIVTVNGAGPRAERASCSFSASPTVTSCEMSAMSSGAWTLTATVTDLAGNMSPISASTQLIISAGQAPISVGRSAVAPTSGSNKNENVVVVKFGTSAALAGIQSVSFIVIDGKGKVVRRANVKVNPGDTGASIVIPKSIKGARVRVMTTNQCGVSEGSPRNFNVRPGKTSVSVDQKSNIPTLAGQLVLPRIDFAASEITLDAGDKALLDKALAEMKGKCGTLMVTGYARHNRTDSRRYLQNLADFRAQAVADYLSGKGLTMWITYQGFVIKAPGSSAGEYRRASLYWTPS